MFNGDRVKEMNFQREAAVMSQTGAQQLTQTQETTQQLTNTLADNMHVPATTMGEIVSAATGQGFENVSEWLSYLNREVKRLAAFSVTNNNRVDSLEQDMATVKSGVNLLL